MESLQGSQNSQGVKGLVFAIEEMAVHEGPGLRSAIFLKGCPLRCKWCHNPEGWTMTPQRVKNPNGCIGCGACQTPCSANCSACGACLPNCPRELLRISGTWWGAKALAAHVRKNEPFLQQGGVTISGGEVLMQPQFLIELLKALAPLHRAVETSGYGSSFQWKKALAHLELVYYDIKLVDEKRHRYFTGVNNALILKNLTLLKNSGVPFILRIPTIQGVNDDAQNMMATSKLLVDAPGLIGVELLPYNTYAGAKYPLIGADYPYQFKQPTAHALERAKKIFAQKGIQATVR